MYNAKGAKPCLTPHARNSADNATISKTKQKQNDASNPVSGPRTEMLKIDYGTGVQASTFVLKARL